MVSQIGVDIILCECSQIIFLHVQCENALPQKSTSHKNIKPVATAIWMRKTLKNILLRAQSSVAPKIRFIGAEVI